MADAFVPGPIDAAAPQSPPVTPPAEVLAGGGTGTTLATGALETSRG